jgi:hypothetical protein
VNRIDVHLWVAAVLQWLVASSNLFAARIFAYREELAKLSPFVREVFIVQNIYIMSTVAMFGWFSTVPIRIFFWCKHLQIYKGGVALGSGSWLSSGGGTRCTVGGTATPAA